MGKLQQLNMILGVLPSIYPENSKDTHNHWLHFGIAGSDEGNRIFALNYFEKES